MNQGPEAPSTPTQPSKFKRFLKGIWPFSKKAVAWPFRMLGKIVGSISYSSPAWWTKMRTSENKYLRKISDNRRQFKMWRSAHKKIVRSSYAVIFLALASWGGWYAYKNFIPHPSWISFTIESPRPMNLQLENPKPNPARVTFSQSAAKLDLVGKEISEGVTLSPAIEGRWVWENDRTLAFFPVNEWPVGEEFKVSIDPKILGSVELTDHSGTFKSDSFSIYLNSSEFYQHPTIPKEKKGVVSLSFNYPVDPESLSERVSAVLTDEKGKSQDIKFTIQYGPKLTTAYIHSDFLEIPKRDSRLRITVAKGVKAGLPGSGVGGKVEASIPVPGMFNYFRIASASAQVIRNESFVPEHVFIISTTAGARTEEIAKNLSVSLLPVQNPHLDSHSKVDRWELGQVSQQVKGSLTNVKLEMIPSEFESSQAHSFKFEAPVGRWVYLKINKGVKSFGDYVLAGDYETVIRIPEFPKEVLIMHNGSILSLKGEKKIPVLSRNVPAIQFKARRLRPMDLHHFITQSEGNFQDPRFVNQWTFSEDNVAETFTEEREVDVTDPAKTTYHSFDFTKYLNSAATTGSRGIFFFSATEWNPATKRTVGQGSKRFIVLTDLGVISKMSVGGEYQVYVQSFHSGLPVAGAKVDVLAVNGTTLFSDTTDSLGHANFPSLKGLDHEKKPVAITVKSGDDYTFLPFGRYDRTLNMARFDVGGVESSSDADRVLAFVFSDRGIYRPGDTSKFGVIPKNLSWKPLPTAMPLEFVITDPRGTELMKETFAIKGDSMEEFSYATSEESPTGSYNAQVYLVKNGQRSDMLGSVTFKVEEFLPDRMKILTTLSKEAPIGWVKADKLSAKILLSNLFGTPAQSRRVSSEFHLYPGFPSTRAFPDYVFMDPKRADKSYTEKLEDATTDDNGEAQVDIDLTKFASASYRLEFVAEGFEVEGGRSVSASSSVFISPLDFVVGYKADGDMSFMKTNTPRKISFLALNNEMKKTTAKGLKAAVIEYRYVSVLTQQPDGTYRYQSVKKEIPVGEEKPITVGERGLDWTLDTSKGGTFALVLKGPEGAEYAKVPYSVIAPSGLARGLEKNAELQIALNKSDFAKGEEIELQIRAPYTGAGLITIEREKVYSAEWFKTNSETSVQKIRIPAGLEGNAYVSVTFLRALDSKQIYTSPLSYGVAPFTISRDSRRTTVTLKAPEMTRPGEPLKIRYSASRPTSMVLYGVDEGILQVASYKLPDPLAFFFTKRSLQVETMQILDLLLPEFSVFQSLSAAGGDEGGSAVAANLNPFKRRRDKPVAFWSGVISASPVEKTYVYDVPDYFSGSLRLMAVAASSSAVGNQSMNTTVRGDFVLSPNIPTFVTPGDEFEVSVGVSNTATGSVEAKGVKLSLKTSEHLEVIAGGEKSLDIKEGSEKSEKFKVRAKDLLGSASLKFVAEWNGKSAKSTTDLSLRPAVPYMTDLKMGLVKSATQSVPVDRKMYAEHRKLNVSASILPLSLADGLMAYLDEYPYGCTEQIVSKGFPTLILSGRTDFKVSADFLYKSYSTVLKTLRLRQTALGGFGLWNSNPESFDFPSLYAIHYLTEAKDRGLGAGNDLLERGIGYLKSGSLDRAGTLHEARLWAYSLYLRARNAVVPKESLQTLRGLLDAKYKDQWMNDLTGVYLAGTYALLQQPEEGLRILKAYKRSIKGLFDWNFFYDSTIRDSQYLFIAGKHFPELIKTLSADDLSAMLEPLMNGGYTTTNSSYAVLGLDAYARASDLNGDSTVKDAKVFEKTSAGENQLQLSGGLFPKSKFSDKALEIILRNPNAAKVFYQTTEAGFDTSLPKKEIQDGMEVQRSYLTDNMAETSKVKNGDELWVRLRTRTLGSHGTVNNVAVVDLLPGGFEVVMDSIRRPQVVEAEPINDAPSEGSSEGSQPYNDDGGSVESGGEEGGGEEGGDVRFQIQPDAWKNGLDRLLEKLSPASAFAQTRTIASAPTSHFDTRSIDIREDRVIVFGSIRSDMSEFFYKIKATNVGEFVVPPPFAESMYDRNLKARGMASKISVER